MHVRALVIRGSRLVWCDEHRSSSVAGLKHTVAVLHVHVEQVCMALFPPWHDYCNFSGLHMCVKPESSCNDYEVVLVLEVEVRGFDGLLFSIAFIDVACTMSMTRAHETRRLRCPMKNFVVNAQLTILNWY